MLRLNASCLRVNDSGPNEAFFTIFDFLEGGYPDRRHSELCYLLTNNDERRMSSAA